MRSAQRELRDTTLCQFKGQMNWHGKAGNRTVAALAPEIISPDTLVLVTTRIAGVHSLRPVAVATAKFTERLNPKTLLAGFRLGRCFVHDVSRSVDSLRARESRWIVFCLASCGAKTFLQVLYATQKGGGTAAGVPLPFFNAPPFRLATEMAGNST